jgi:hypothetical protein
MAAKILHVHRRVEREQSRLYHEQLQCSGRESKNRLMYYDEEGRSDSRVRFVLALPPVWRTQRRSTLHGVLYNHNQQQPTTDMRVRWMKWGEERKKGKRTVPSVSTRLQRRDAHTTREGSGKSATGREVCGVRWSGVEWSGTSDFVVTGFVGFVFVADFRDQRIVRIRSGQQFYQTLQN